jgi:protein-S-isoprenylcysteine O-methyltransferase Ste14
MLVRVAAVLCYLLGMAGASAFGGLILLLGLDLLPPRFSFSPPWPLVVDLLWLLVFGVQHSVMAREGFKQRWVRLVPPRLERSVYVALSGALCLLLALAWQPLPGPPLWRGPRWLVIVPLLAAVGLALVNARHDHADFFGLRQAWAGDRSPPPEQLIVGGPYRYIRHPLMACLLVFLWAQPVLSPTLALLAGGLTAYITVGVVLEERDLLRRFGPAYAAYRRRVPALIPWRWPARPLS